MLFVDMRLIAAYYRATVFSFVINTVFDFDTCVRSINAFLRVPSTNESDFLEAKQTELRRYRPNSAPHWCSYVSIFRQCGMFRYFKPMPLQSLCLLQIAHVIKSLLNRIRLVSACLFFPLFSGKVTVHLHGTLRLLTFGAP